MSESDKVFKGLSDSASAGGAYPGIGGAEPEAIQVKTWENVGAGALAGAAVGAVASLAVPVTAMAVPLIGTGLGAGLGALVGRIASHPK